MITLVKIIMFPLRLFVGIPVYVMLLTFDPGEAAYWTPAVLFDFIIKGETR